MQHEVFVTQLPQTLDALQNIACNMVAVVNNALKSFSDMQQLLVKKEGGKVCVGGGEEGVRGGEGKV